MLRLLSAAAVFAVLGTAAHAQEGTYFGSGEGELTAKIKHIQDDKYAISLETVVPMENDMPGCAGGVEGEATLDQTGGTLSVENPDYEPGSDSPMFGQQYCQVKLSFDDQGFLNIEEQDGCLSYHGAACGFTGQLLNDAAVN